MRISHFFSAFTLLETIIASFLLLMGFLVSVRLFDAALRYETDSESKRLAALLASNKFEEIRAWNNLNHYPVGTLNFSDWSAYNGVTTADPQHPEFTVATTCTPQTSLFTPCSTFESLYLTAAVNLSASFSVGNNCRSLTDMEQVVVRVSWGGQSFQWSGLMGAPSPTLSQINLLAPSVSVLDTSGNPISGLTLHHEDVVVATAHLKDSNNKEIQVLWNWSIVGPGNGVLLTTRDGRYASFTHHFYVRRTRELFLDYENCALQAQTTYQGNVYIGVSGSVSLAP